MPRKYLSGRFEGQAFRTYTYHDDFGLHLEPGDVVQVTARGRRSELTVVEVDLAQPAFPTKQIDSLVRKGGRKP